MHHGGLTQAEQLTVEVVGGALTLSFKKIGAGDTDIRLQGHAEVVFDGVWG